MPKQPAKVSKKDKPINNEIAYILTLLGAIALLFLTTFNLHLFIEKQQVLGSTTVISNSNNEIGFWEVFLNENENYIEGWFELARLKLGEGDINGAREAVIMIERINPNSEELTKLKKSL
jgi:hypothetical protein